MRHRGAQNQKVASPSVESKNRHLVKKERSFHTAWKAGHPVNTDLAFVDASPITGSPAFAGDDDRWEYGLY
jgi:hypothetical protein